MLVEFHFFLWCVSLRPSVCALLQLNFPRASFPLLQSPRFEFVHPPVFLDLVDVEHTEVRIFSVAIEQ